jgi:hypothetical protein
MQTRMASARCCCGQTGVIPCDPITGITDTFETYQQSQGVGGWSFSGGTTYAPTIQPLGTLLVQQSSAFVGSPFSFDRCAVWNAGFTYFRWVLAYQWENFGGQGSTYIAGPYVNADFANGSQRWFLRNDIEFAGSWYHRLELVRPGNTSIVRYRTLLQAAQFPQPTGPFEAEIQLLLIRLLSGAWQCHMYFNGSLLASGATQQPANADMPEFRHGFGASSRPIDPLLTDVAVLRADRWQYFAAT